MPWTGKNKLRHGLVALAGVLAAGGVAAAALGAAAPAAAQSVAVPPIPDAKTWRPLYVTGTHPALDHERLVAQAANGTTIPFWSTKITSPLDKHTYTVDMVGSSPYISYKFNTSIHYVPIIARIHFPGGFVLDPTKPATCDNVSVLERFINSPLFLPATFTSNGVNVSKGAVGGTQLESAFQRANFWSSVQNSNYGVTLVAASKPIVVDVTAPPGSSITKMQATCGKHTPLVNLGIIFYDSYDTLIQGLAKKYAKPNQLPLVLTYNVVQYYVNGCCIIGYHNAIPVTGGTQTYAVGAWVDAGLFVALDTTVAWAHELGEWMDDPFVQASVPGGGADDTTPAWGNVGQVTGCQNNLEVGDPLSGTEWRQVGHAGFSYGFQDLTFHDWFYRTKSTSAGKLYSFKGTFHTAQGTCSAAP